MASSASHFNVQKLLMNCTCAFLGTAIKVASIPDNVSNSIAPERRRPSPIILLLQYHLSSSVCDQLTRLQESHQSRNENQERYARVRKTQLDYHRVPSSNSTLRNLPLLHNRRSSSWYFGDCDGTGGRGTSRRADGGRTGRPDAAIRRTQSIVWATSSAFLGQAFKVCRQAFRQRSPRGATFHFLFV